MKNLFTVLLLLLQLPSFARENPYAKIDKYAASVGYLPSAELAEKLTSPYQSDSEKVRSIFYWITQHISYDVYEYHHPTIGSYGLDYYEDSVKAKEDYYTRYAEKVLKKKMGICEGYSTLFKLLCDKAHIECIKISGDARTTLRDIGRPFEEIHAWNAVRINGAWRLIDACWASGNCNYGVTKFTKKFNDYYYCTPPKMFALDHYPTDSTLLYTDEPVSRENFMNSPLVNSDAKSMVIDQFTPLTGKLVARLGDTLRFELAIRKGLDSINRRYGSFVTEFDATGKIISPYARLEKSQHFRREGDRIYYDYKVWTTKATDLYLLYNNRYILSYKLVVTK